MKPWIAGVIAFLIVFFLSSCAGFLKLNDPILGRYKYTVNDQHTAVVPKKVIPIWIDKNFGAADQIAIDDAIRQWNYAMNGYIRLEVVDTSFDMEVPKIVDSVRRDGWLFMKIAHDNPMVPENTKGYWTIGFTERVGGHHLYLVRDRLGNDDVFGVTLHEIGHLMGSDHVGIRLMYPHYTRARFQCIDWETIRAVAGYWELDPANLNFCVDKNAGEVDDLEPQKKLEQKLEMDKGPLL